MSTAKPEQQPSLGQLEEDDEFEEFAVEDWGAGDEDKQDLHQWEDNWDDDDVSDDFSQQLRDVKQIAKIGGVCFPPPKNLNISSIVQMIKQHSKEADELDELCMKLGDFRVKNNANEATQEDDDLRLCDVPMEQLMTLVHNVQHFSSQELGKQSVVKFRRLLAHDDIHPHLDKIIATGVVRNFVMFLDTDQPPDLHFECAWILTNISAGTSAQTRAVVECGAIDPLLNLIKSTPYKEIREQSIWCLGNLAGDGPDIRKTIAERNALGLLVASIEKEMQEFLASTSFTAEFPTQFSGNRSPRKTHRDYNLSTLRISIWALSNFCRGTNHSELDWNLINVALPLLSQIIVCCSPGSHHTDDEILMDACWALSRTLRGIHEGIAGILVDKETCSNLGALICYDNSEVQVPALRCLINIVSGCDAQTQVVIDAGLLRHLHQLIQNTANETVCKEACLIISNITAGPSDQVQAVIEECIMPTLINLLHVADYRIKREACWALGNALLNKSVEQTQYLVSIGLLDPLVKLLHVPQPGDQFGIDERVLTKTLEAIRNILQVGEEIAAKHSAAVTVPTSIEAELLSSFNTLNIQQVPQRKPLADSAYSSLTDLFEKKPSKNAYLNDCINANVPELLDNLMHSAPNGDIAKMSQEIKGLLEKEQ